VATYFISQRYNTSRLTGPLVDAGVGYLGVQLSAEDGPHFGWVRLRMAPVVSVVDWAYESRPNTPIHAGDITPNQEIFQFTVDFENLNDVWPDSSGTLILKGNLLRGELTLSGLFSSADLTGPAPGRAKAKPIGSLGQPLVQGTNFTSFLGDIRLSHSQRVHLLHGAIDVSIDGDTFVGRISRNR
jgi:hypothetical protein